MAEAKEARKSEMKSNTPKSVQIVYKATVPQPHQTNQSPWYAFTLSYENARLTVPSFLVWFISLAIHTYASKITLHRGTSVHDLRHSPPLFDIIHDYTPSFQQYRIVPELCYLAPVLFTSALMLYHFDQRSLDCIRTFLWTHAFLLCFRAISFSSTLLPDSSQTCHTSIFTGSCYDLIYSGHVMIMLLSILLGQHFFILNPIINAIFILDLAVTSVLVIVTRNHYTVDVVIALLMTPLTFIAFTRHPPLVSLSCLVPEKILAKESKVKSCISCFGLGRRNNNNNNNKIKSSDTSGGDNDKRVDLQNKTNEKKTNVPLININSRKSTATTLHMGADGYPIVSLQDFERITEHAYSAIRLLGVQQQQYPQFVGIYKTDLKSDQTYTQQSILSTRTAAAAAARTHEGGEGLDQVSSNDIELPVPLLQVSQAPRSNMGKVHASTQTEAEEET